MKIRTIDQLLRRIADDHVWRIREISALRSQCRANSNTHHAQHALRRAFLPIAYAHWEGFVKKASHYYLEFVAMQGLKLSEMSLPFASMYLLQVERKNVLSEKSYALVEVCDTLLNRPNDRVNLEYKNAISTKSNLDSKVLESTCRSLGLDYKEFKPKEQFIKKLLSARNNIAHGEYREINIEEIDETKNEIIWLIDRFRNKIENAAAESEYKIVN